MHILDSFDECMMCVLMCIYVTKMLILLDIKAFLISWTWILLWGLDWRLL